MWLSLRCTAVAACAVAMLAGCMSSVPPPSIVPGPLTAAPIPRPANIEQAHTGSLYRTSVGGSSFTGRARPSAIGDTLKVEISESLSSSSTVKTDISRQSALSSKGTGNASSNSPLAPIFNQNDNASGSNTFKGNGSTKNDSNFTGELSTTVINVLANGNLLVAGERVIAMQGNNSTLRFSGLVDPRDIKDGNIVQSVDVVNARLEVVGQGDTSEAASRSWINRLLTNSFSNW